MRKNVNDMEALHQNSPSHTIGKENVSEERRYIPRDRLTSYLSEVRREDIPWAVNFLVSQLVTVEEPDTPQKKHLWENYELTPEIKALSSFERKKLPLNYDDALTEALEEKHK